MYTDTYIHIYARASTRPGAHPGYIHACICTCPRLHSNVYICFYSAGVDWTLGEWYIQSVMAQASRLHGSGCTSTPWREVTLMKILRFSWFAFHFFEESHVVGKAVGSGKSFDFCGLHSISSKESHVVGQAVGSRNSVREKILGKNQVLVCMRECNHRSLIDACTYIYMYMQPGWAPRPRRCACTHMRYTCMII